MNPFRSNSQRHDRPIAIEPLTAGTKYSARIDLDPAQLAVDDDRQPDREHDQDRRHEQVDRASG